jgi:hypothetical protein
MRHNEQWERDVALAVLVQALKGYRKKVIRDLCDPTFRGEDDQEFLTQVVRELNAFLGTLEP